MQCLFTTGRLGRRHEPPLKKGPSTCHFPPEYDDYFKLELMTPPLFKLLT